MSALDKIMSGVPTPARGGSESKKADTGSAKDAKLEKKALRRALAELRRLAALTEETYMFAADTPEASEDLRLHEEQPQSRDLPQVQSVQGGSNRREHIERLVAKASGGLLNFSR